MTNPANVIIQIDGEGDDRSWARLLIQYGDDRSKEAVVELHLSTPPVDLDHYNALDYSKLKPPLHELIEALEAWRQADDSINTK